MSRVCSTLSALAFGGLLVSCSSDASPNPSPPSGTPATIGISAGDQQSAAAGTAVAVAPAVIVRDAEQNPVSGASVQFSVTSGGGTLMGATPVTDANGIARLGRWTLGQGGEQRLSAQVGSLGAVTFQATIETPGTGGVETTIGTGGGVLEITTAGHPYEGLRLTIPAGTFPGTESLTLSVAQNPSLPTLPAGYRVSGPVLQVSSSQLRGSKLMTLQVPVSHGANEQVLIAFHDPARGITEIMPTVYRDDTLLVVVTGHLRPDLLLGPGTAGTLRAGGVDPVGWMMPVAYTVPLQPIGPVLNLLSGRWPVIDHGSATQPNGFGLSITSLESLVAAQGKSFEQLEIGLLFDGFYKDAAELATATKTHLLITSTVGVVVQEYRAMLLTILNQFGRLRAAGSGLSAGGPFDKPAIDELVNHTVVAMMAFSNKPVPVALNRTAPGLPPLFATAFAGSETTVNLVVPALEEVAVLLRNVAQGFQSLNLPPVADQVPVAVNEVIPLSSFLVDFTAVAEPLRKLLELSAMPLGSASRRAATLALMADAGVPTIPLAAQAGPGQAFAPVTDDTVVVRGESSTIRIPTSIGGVSSGFLVSLASSGVELARVDGTDVSLDQLPNYAAIPDGVPTDIVASAFNRVGGLLKQVSAQFVTVVKAPFVVTPSTSTISLPFEEITFAASVPMPPASGYVIVWEWGNDFIQSIQDSPVATYSYAEVDDYQVIANMYDQVSGALLGSDTVQITMSQVARWRLTSIADADGFFDGFVDGEDPITAPLERVLTVPGQGLISVSEYSVNSNKLELRTLPTPWDTTLLVPDIQRYPDEVDLPLGEIPAKPYTVGPFFAGWNADTWSESSTNLGQGTMSGQHLFGTTVYTVKDAGQQVGPRGAVRLTGNRNGTTMTGTISVWIWFINEDDEIDSQPEEYKFPFTAKRLR